MIHCYKLDTTDSFPTLPNARSYNHTDIRRYKTKLFQEDPTTAQKSVVNSCTQQQSRFISFNNAVLSQQVVLRRHELWTLVGGFSPRRSGFCHCLFMWKFSRVKRHWGRFPSEYFASSLPIIIPLNKPYSFITNEWHKHPIWVSTKQIHVGYYYIYKDRTAIILTCIQTSLFLSFLNGSSKEVNCLFL